MLSAIDSDGLSCDRLGIDEKLDGAVDVVLCAASFEGHALALFLEVLRALFAAGQDGSWGNGVDSNVRGKGKGSGLRQCPQGGFTQGVTGKERR